ncbi:adenylyl-sulfate kinase [Undibacterium seohonense]|jgi:adenylylsulfate kinase|uniref:Adenylyl-sulfate kinase n=1 Tax=Undibacterium seohonense TaxID=1344950 RepID=A0ABR6X0G4_9BURK|nr:adenylyl-sulfate kinase [Undibacterium seohonense]MBC3806261.1 adenylyl-sulfate kinase [Undibacterium seohonense]
MNQTMTWWLTGLSGAGKSTLAQALASNLRQSQHAVCVLDGDELRLGLSKDLGFSAEDREEQCRRVAEIAKTLNANGIFVVVALISPTLSSRSRARQIIGSERMLEVYVSTPLDVCQERDVKGLYAKARKETSLQLTGVQAPYEAPVEPDLVINTAQVSLDQGVQILLDSMAK